MVAMVGGFSFPLIIAPGSFRSWLLRFPRNIWAGRILSALAIFWAGWLVYQMPLGQFVFLRPLVFPVSFLLGAFVWFFMDELLSARALGALLLLLPAPILHVARVHDSPFSVVMSVVSYLCVIKGMGLLLNPHWFRLSTAYFLKTNMLARIYGGIGIGVSVLLLLLGIFVY